VDVEAEDGRIIGRVTVSVEERNQTPAALSTLVY
jgi:hypothetical protein